VALQGAALILFIMERIITIVCLVLSAAGLGYLKMNQLERMEAEKAAQAESEALALAEADAAAAEAAKFHFTVQHDKDMQTDSIRIVMQGYSSDPDQDNVNYQWEQIGGATLALDSDTNSVATFSATNGEYSFRLTVTDSYGASSSDEAVVKIHPEPNNSPSAEIDVRAKE